MREIEIKLKASDLTAVTEKLKALGCIISEPKTQEDRNFVHRDDVRWFESVTRGFAYPRLRISPGKPLIFTVKKPVKNEMDCIEHEICIDNARELEKMMEVLEYRKGVTVKKTRRTTEYKGYTITLDEVEKLGNFVEVERLVEDGDALAIQEEMFTFAKNVLDLDRGDHVMKGYDILMYQLESKNSFI